MPFEIIALLDKPHLLVAILLVGGLIGIAVEQFVSELERRRWRRFGGMTKRWSWRGGTYFGRADSASSRMTEGPLPSWAEQLAIVMKSDFSVQPLLNKGEERLFRELEQMVAEANSSWRVMAQVSLGEIVSSKDAAAYSCVNSKRVDLLLVDGLCRPRHVIEYQGSGHYQGTAAARDAIKKEALRRAGIGYFEIIAGSTVPSDLRLLVERVVERQASPQAGPLAVVKTETNAAAV